MASFLFLPCPLEHRRDHFSLGDSGWVRLQPSSSERATFASPFCLESDRKTDTHSSINAKAFTQSPPRTQTKTEVDCPKPAFLCDEIQFDSDVNSICCCLNTDHLLETQRIFKSKSAAALCVITRSKLITYLSCWLFKTDDFKNDKSQMRANGVTKNNLKDLFHIYMSKCYFSWTCVQLLMFC